MKIYKSSEDYLERILVLKKQNGKVISIDIANSMNFSKPSISRAMKNLKENNYITINANGEIDLTEKGLNIANRIYERHVILSSYFMRLGVSEEIAKEDACKIEHDLSDETFEAIKNHIKQEKSKN
ncbi:MAG: metal-dependent transcriptional regulator [Bacilli bacterium]|nr:metal-dependent transcriptional regulator [Acholeplasmataceae bacterium]MDY2902497.1 metal-dependent transcriptional regulator [Bacilli bacterium]